VVTQFFLIFGGQFSADVGELLQDTEQPDQMFPECPCSGLLQTPVFVRSDVLLVGVVIGRQPVLLPDRATDQLGLDGFEHGVAGVEADGVLGAVGGDDGQVVAVAAGRGRGGGGLLQSQRLGLGLHVHEPAGDQHRLVHLVDGIDEALHDAQDRVIGMAVRHSLVVSQVQLHFV